MGRKSGVTGLYHHGAGIPQEAESLQQLHGGREVSRSSPSLSLHCCWSSSASKEHFSSLILQKFLLPPWFQGDDLSS